MFLPILVDAVLGQVLSIARSAFSAIKEHRDLAHSVEGAKKALALDRSQLGVAGYRHSSLHPIYGRTNSLHPDEVRGLAGLLHEDIRTAERHGQIQLSPEVQSSIGHSLLLVCGPAWEAVTRLVFGYADHAGNGHGSGSDSLAYNLPYRFDIDADGIHAEAARFVQSERRWTVEREPNWGIVGLDGKRLYPTLTHDGFLRTDYLLLTKVPNFLADPTAGSEHFIVNFAGTHGVGQRSIDLLLSNQALLKRVAERLAIDPDVACTWPEAYQALFRVGDITHSERKGSKATGMVLVDALRVEESPQWWAGWNRRVRGPLDEWHRAAQQLGDRPADPS